MRDGGQLHAAVRVLQELRRITVLRFVVLQRMRVDHVLRIIQSEMSVTLGLTGVNDVRDLDRTVVVEP